MTLCSSLSFNFTATTLPSCSRNKPSTSSHNQLFIPSRLPSSNPRILCLSVQLNQIFSRTHFRKSKAAPCMPVVASGEKGEPLRVMISGAPASGKGTQLHIAAGDLLRAEVAAGSKIGKLAKEYMKKGQLAPNEIVAMMVKDRLSQQDSEEKGWLLDGHPKSASQANALKDFGFDPDIFLLLEYRVDRSLEILVERVVAAD